MQRSLAAKELAFFQAEYRRKKELSDALRLKQEKAGLGELGATAKDAGVLGLFEYAHAELSISFTQAAPIGGALAFMGVSRGRKVSILRLFPARSDRQRGLCFAVHSTRLLDHLGERSPEGKDQVMTSFPLTQNAVKPGASGWQSGYLAQRSQIDEVAATLAEHGFERQQREEILAAENVPDEEHRRQRAW